MLYTRKGDSGTTCAFGCDQRFSKSEKLAEALGTVDELNSYIGLCKSKIGKDKSFAVGERSVYEILTEIQQNLFTIQAEIAGADKHITQEKVDTMEKIIADIEKILPPIHSFFIPGSTERSALFDMARAIARRAERREVAFCFERDGVKTQYGEVTVPVKEQREASLVYLNRLSSLLYALARLANHASEVKEEVPEY
ncbi:MAG TPA: cob(I)yrinic acid a,c-diamide adenosyltransferase [Candidatus Kaiserbacteria bacterium]|nr:cob(I)yrinic acid a,c-diamide adenosyltransferase [Candidatus Kaiserbacteria bacterium]